MYDIKIDEALCKKDGLCAMTCMRSIFQQKEKNTLPQIIDSKFCYGCGQCMAICSHGAISHSRYPDGTVTPIISENMPSYDQVMELIRSRRSKRLFKNRPIEKDVLDKVIDAARFAPSGHNEQSTQFIVVQDRDKIHEIGKLTAKGLVKMAQPFRYAIGRMIMRRVIGARSTEYVTKMVPELETLAAKYNEGDDMILRQAPTLLLFCADSVGGTFAGVNANLALHNATLAAETVGLGCFYTGFVVIVSDRDSSICSSVGLPDTHKIYGALAVGYPRLKFKNWQERNPPKVTWL